jgi:prepilin-type N-terminal cleavage/methylation domain-containing protein
MKRRGFTLIELMVVIAIIIILAAIAIPNYLTMTKRAKNSRLEADMATLATALETYKTDWGSYPIVATAEGVSVNTTVVNHALTGPESLGGLGGDLNVVAHTNAVGEKGPINYIKAGTMTSIVNPFGLPLATSYVYYKTIGAGSAATWTLYAQTDTATWLARTDSTSTASVVTTQP